MNVGRIQRVGVVGVVFGALAVLAFLALRDASAGATEPDGTAPNVTLSGSAVQAVEEAKTTGSYELRIVATDGSKTAPQSGVAKIEVPSTVLSNNPGKNTVRKAAVVSKRPGPGRRATTPQSAEAT